MSEGAPKQEVPASPESGKKFSSVRIYAPDGKPGTPTKVERVEIDEDDYGNLVLKYRVIGGTSQIYEARQHTDGVTGWVADPMD